MAQSEPQTDQEKHATNGDGDVAIETQEPPVKFQKSSDGIGVYQSV